MPAIIGDLPVITTSSRSTFRRCHQRWYWQYVLGLNPKTTPNALWFGIGVHEALALWYRKGRKRGPHPAETFELWHQGEEEREIFAARSDRELQQIDDAKYEDALTLGVDMLEGYVEEYGRDPYWKVIAVEHPFKIRVIYQGKPIAYFMSTWDGVYLDLRDWQIYLMEHKTATAVQTAYLELDDQGGIYWAVAQAVLRAKGILKPDEEIAGITYNFLRKARKDQRQQNAAGESLNLNGTVSKRQPIERFVRETMERSPRERRTQMERLAKEARLMTGMISGELPVTKNTQKDCPQCPFFTICKLHERGGSAWKEVASVDFTKGEPYDRYLKTAAA